MKTLTEMHPFERALLLFLECRSVDHGGLVDTRNMCADDFSICARWVEEGFIEFGRLTRKSISRLGGSTYWVKLSEDAWKMASEERRARYERIHAQREWQTTAEKREARRIGADEEESE